MSRQGWIGAILCCVTLAATGVPPSHAEEGTVQAVSSWQGRVRVFAVGPQQGFALGTFGGLLFVEKQQGVLDAARITCPGAIEADYAAGTQRGEGRCVITTRGGDRVFAKWNCAGQPDVGCTGTFTLTGGTGKLQGISGEGAIVLRLVVAELVRLGAQEQESDVAGLAVWPALRYKTP